MLVVGGVVQPPLTPSLLPFNAVLGGAVLDIHGHLFPRSAAMAILILSNPPPGKGGNGGSALLRGWREAGPEEDLSELLFPILFSMALQKSGALLSALVILLLCANLGH
jgi:hypothetical protein